MKAALHPNEPARLAALNRYAILDTPMEPAYDAVVKLVAAICEVPIAVINLIDDGRQWFKAEVGMGVREMPLDASICAHAILQPGLFVIPDTQADPRFKSNPLVTGDPHLRFYAGALLQSSEGLPLGTVCVLDYKPRELTEHQKNLLLLMAEQVMAQFELRITVRAKEDALARAAHALAEKDTLIREMDHRVQNSLSIVSAVLRLQSNRLSNAETKEALEDAQRRVQAIATVHRQLQGAENGRTVEVSRFLRQLCADLERTNNSGIKIQTFAQDGEMDSAKATALGIVINELVTNAMKYAYPQGSTGTVTVEWEMDGSGWTLRVSDDGVGLGGNAPASEGLGSKILKACVSQLGATLRIAPRDPGVAFIVSGANAALAREAAPGQK